MNTLEPNQRLNCLLVYPEFSQFSFWNTKDVVQSVGAKAPAAPLGLITVAAILPQHWRFRLLDLNTRCLSEEDWQWADIVCTGGMLPQQKGLLSIIEKARKTEKFVVVGGPDPTSQPDLYERANALVLGEGEVTIPQWLKSWRQGQPTGTFSDPQKADMSHSPIPRYDLLCLEDYFQVGVQYARGCPFNCEFCDIIELYGRKPRQKTPQQFLDELEVLYNTGYRGYVEIVDDNFIGNKRNVKRYLLPQLISWNRKKRRPFHFGTEASMNLGDDAKLLELMRQANFRYVFMGIETPDPKLLMQTQKSHNTMRPITERVNKVYSYGIIVTAGFIIGFDNEPDGMDRSIIRCIEDTGICMAMVGLLVALPNTQLSRRLKREGRLLSFGGEIVSDSNQKTSASLDHSIVEVIDQTLAGLNFITTRDRNEILREFINITSTIYQPDVYMRRVYRLVRRMGYRLPYIPSFFELKRSLMGLFITIGRLGFKPKVARHFWTCFFKSLCLGLYRFECAMTLMALYVHFSKQSQHLAKTIDRQIFDNYRRQQISEDKMRTARPATSAAVMRELHSADTAQL